MCIYGAITMANPSLPSKDNLLEKSWCDSKWIPFINASNIMEYFSDRSNPFYDSRCNNEVIKMQRLNPDMIKQMKGMEYELIHAQDPILFVVRRQNRVSTTEVVPEALYYVLAGVVYQAPDMWSVINSRLLNTCFALQKSLAELGSAARFHPSLGYVFDLHNVKGKKLSMHPAQKNDYDVRGTRFQRFRTANIISRVLVKHELVEPEPMDSGDVNMESVDASDTNINGQNTGGVKRSASSSDLANKKVKFE